MIRVGFSGTGQGMTLRQRHAVARYLIDLHPDEFHHGVCVGADEEAHLIVRALFPDCRIVGHPGVDPYGGAPKRSRTAAADLDDCLPERPYLERNGDLAAFDWLIAAPEGFTERRRSGTWATVRRARKHDTPTLFAWPVAGLRT